MSIPLLNEKLNTETARISWEELQPHFARGAAVCANWNTKTKRANIRIWMSICSARPPICKNQTAASAICKA
ncbi:DUF2288 family protein [Neisseria sp.]